MQKHKKTLGIIGGMGPLATAHFYQVLIRQTEAEHDQDHPRVLIDSNPQIPDRTLALIGKGPSPVPAIIEAAQNLVKVGAHLLAMPCITAHAFFHEIQESVKIPVIHMLEESVQYYQNRFLNKKIGLLATAGTLRSGLLQNYFDSNSLVFPDEETLQEIIMRAIYGKTGVKGGNLKDARRILQTACDKLIGDGAEILLAGCTEISIIIQNMKYQVPFLDPVEVLAEVCLSKLQEP